MIIFSYSQKIHIARVIKDEVDRIVPSNLTEDQKSIMKIIMRGVADAILLLPTEE